MERPSVRLSDEEEFQLFVAYMRKWQRAYELYGDVQNILINLHYYQREVDSMIQSRRPKIMKSAQIWKDIRNFERSRSEEEQGNVER